MAPENLPVVITDDIRRALDKAKIGLMQKTDSAFFTTIVFSLKWRWDNTQATAWTDGVQLGFNSNFFMAMPPEERIGVLVHEAVHVAMLHMERLGTLDPDLWNDACDHWINLMLLARGFKLPSFGLMDERFKDMDVKPIYDILMAEKQQGIPQPKNMMADLRAPEKPQELVKHVENILVRARIHSRMAKEGAGAIPGEIELYLDNLLAPKLPWFTILRKYFSKYAKTDYSWKRPNRRLFPDHYLPSLHSEKLMDLAWAVDISGSETDADFLRFISEAAGVIRMLKPDEITLIQWDTCIKSVDKVRSIKKLSEIKFTGRGGTDINCVLDWARKNKPQLLLIFTDGDFDPPKEHYTGDVVWLIHDDPYWTAPGFGKVIFYNTHS